MSIPPIRTGSAQQPATNSPVKGGSPYVDSANVSSPPKQATPSNPGIQPVYADEKERRLNEYVSKMDELRKTTGVEGYRITQTNKIKGIVLNLLGESEKIEEHINLGENEMFFKNDEVFFMRQDESELAQLQMRQAEEAKGLKVLQDQLLKDRANRKEAKKFQRELQRETKQKDSIIHDQETAHKTAKEVKQVLSEHHQRIEQLIAHTEEKHQKQLKQLALTQERKISDQRVMMDLQTKNMSEEERTDHMKEFNFKINHQKNVDKKATDHVRERQTLELRQLKERLELETRTIEETSNFQAQLLANYQQTQRANKQEYTAEKDRIEAAAESKRIVEIQIENNLEYRRLQRGHSSQCRKLKRAQKLRAQKRLQLWNMVHGENSLANSDKMSAESVSSAAESDDGVIDGKGIEDENNTQNALLENQLKEMTEELARMRENLNVMQAKHEDKLEALKMTQKDEIKKKDEEFTSLMMETEWNHEIELKEQRQSQEDEIAESLALYQHELQMEAQVRGVEMKALQERRVLNSLLDSVVDGVISIDPLGIIRRFNAAAEKIFDYPHSQIVGKNIRTLMTKEHSENHDEYLLNYLESGKKKVIGTGRNVLGQKRDGTVFPIHLSVSEVVEEGLHLFTAIVRDMTEQVAEEKRIKAEEERQKKEMEGLLANLAVAKERSTNLLGQMLPENIAGRIMAGEVVKPEQYANATVFFSNIVGFSDITAEAQVHDIVNLLNDLYTYFDNILDSYDVYKVETIGCTYMVVSGIPNRNGDRHASEIADMALSLLAGINNEFEVRHMPDMKLRLQCGLHSGPTVAGVVGTKMPRYCLFGDTVNTAARMESTSSPMRIQCSPTAFEMLNKTGLYNLDKRGEITVKGKAPMTTHWLLGKKGWSGQPLPRPEDWPVQEK